MGLFNDQTKFVQDGAEYEHTDPYPKLACRSVRRFVYGEVDRAASLQGDLRDDLTFTHSWL